MTPECKFCSLTTAPETLAGGNLNQDEDDQMALPAGVLAEAGTGGSCLALVPGLAAKYADSGRQGLVHAGALNENREQKDSASWQKRMSC